ncbi:hypothetical protein M426DRAFT_28081 [Hypoxylon sp. CI-4A]|nr:hypothetical protein M426DRAFT_28081 [Hypoxylon sp. CI-4A]
MNRAPFLQALLSLVPKEILHAAKRVKSIEQTSSEVTVAFEDGTEAHFDAIIGADGIFSSVRNHILGDEREKHATSPAGWWDCRHLVPYEKARAALGDESFKVDRQYAWLGDGASMLHGIVENQTIVQCIIAVIDKDLSTNQKRIVTRQLILDQEDPKGYAEWEHKSTPTYAKDRVCIVGDAAHATSPWQGSGAGVAIEDAFILGHIFGQVSSVGDINAAFRAFDVLRRPRCQKIIDTGRGTGRLFCGQDEAAGLDPKKLNESLGQMFAHIGTLDLESHKKDALETMRAFLSS